MTGTTSRRTGALLVLAAFLASLASATAATTVMAATDVPTCAGRVATIVGTAEGETIIGTAGRDVIAARGGNDRILGRGGDDLICGGPGNDTLVGHRGSDTLYGGRGEDQLHGGNHNDRLYGGPGDDRFDGGRDWDRCNQGPGAGRRVGCEWPIIKRVGKTFAVAWVDLDGDHRFGGDDVLISRVVDTNRDGVPSEGDTIEMGRLPLRLTPTAIGDTRAWGATRHTVRYVQSYTPGHLSVRADGGEYEWNRNWQWEGYLEYRPELDHSASGIEDFRRRRGYVGRDQIFTSTLSPSRPPSSMEFGRKVAGNDGLIEVRVYWQVP